MRSLLVVPALLLVAAPAHAERKSSGLAPADRVHDFHTVDRFTPETTFGIEVGLAPWDSDGLQAIDTIVGLDVGGHFVSTTGAGGYAVLPLTLISTEDSFLGDGETESMIGNIEVGGLYATAINPSLDLVAHLGVALPTASDDDLIDSFQPYGSMPRYGDLVQRWPNSTWLRLGVSPMGTAGPVFWRADLGLDLMLDDDDDTGADISPVLRVNVAGGVDFGKGEATIELATNIVDDNGGNDDETASTLAIGGRFDGGNVFPGLALVLPLGFEDPVDAYVDFMIAFSLMVRLPAGT